MKTAHKKQKNLDQDMNRLALVENSPIPVENSIQPATSSIVFESLDSLKDELESQKDKKVENSGNLLDRNYLSQSLVDNLYKFQSSSK